MFLSPEKDIQFLGSLYSKTQLKPQRKAARAARFGRRGKKGLKRKSFFNSAGDKREPNLKRFFLLGSTHSQRARHGTQTSTHKVLTPPSDQPKPPPPSSPAPLPNTLPALIRTLSPTSSETFERGNQKRATISVLSVVPAREEIPSAMSCG